MQLCGFQNDPPHSVVTANRGADICPHSTLTEERKFPVPGSGRRRRRGQQLSWNGTQDHTHGRRSNVYVVMTKCHQLELAVRVRSTCGDTRRAGELVVELLPPRPVGGDRARTASRKPTHESCQPASLKTRPSRPAGVPTQPSPL